MKKSIASIQTDRALFLPFHNDEQFFFLLFRHNPLNKSASAVAPCGGKFFNMIKEQFITKSISDKSRNNKKYQEKMSSNQLTQALIIDSGSGFIKSGLARYDFPTVCSPNVMTNMSSPEADIPDYRFGQEAINLKQKSLNLGTEDDTHVKDVNLVRPIERGLVKNIDSLELVWYDMYQNLLKLDP